MKNKNLIYGVGVAILLYLLFKSKKGKQVAESVKETVSPSSNEKIYKGMVKDGSASNMRMQYIQLPTMVMEKIGFKSPILNTPQDSFFVENSKGEQRDVVRASKRGIVIAETLQDGTESVYLPTGESFVLYKKLDQ